MLAVLWGTVELLAAEQKRKCCFCVQDNGQQTGVYKKKHPNLRKAISRLWDNRFILKQMNTIH